MDNLKARAESLIARLDRLDRLLAAAQLARRHDHAEAIESRYQRVQAEIIAHIYVYAEETA